MEVSGSRKRKTGGLEEENILAIINASGAKDTQDANDDRTTFLFPLFFFIFIYLFIYFIISIVSFAVLFGYWETAGKSKIWILVCVFLSSFGIRNIDTNCAW